MATFGERMLGAAKLDTAIYEEVEADRTATGHALAVVALVSVATGIGVRAGLGGLVVGAVAAVAGWAAWTYLIYWIGGRWLAEPGTRADWGELLRTVGFAHTPGVLRLLAVLAPLQTLVFLLTGLWTLVAVIVAVRQALDYRSTARAVGVCVLGWIVQSVILVLAVALVETGGA